MDLVIGSSMIEIRIMPYPPSFSRMAARTMDPAIGASTCALGSHKWTPYSGILIRNASMHVSHRMLFDHVVFIVWLLRVISMKFKVPVEFWVMIRAMRSGIDPTRV